MLERPDVPHGPNNKFVSRFAFVAVPADGSLDLNAIHNQALGGGALTFQLMMDISGIRTSAPGKSIWLRFCRI